MVPDRLAVEGETLEAALRDAREQLGVQGSHEMGYEFDRDHFRKGADTVRIYAWLKEENTVGAVRDAMAFVHGFLEHFGVDDGDVQIQEEDGKTVLSLTVGDLGNLLIGRDGKNLAALQHILTKALIHRGHEAKIVLDIEDYRARREDKLRDQARSAIERAQRGRETVEVGPMNSYERRIVHLEVRKVDGVDSRSVGRGQFKTLEIFPSSGD